MRYKISHQTIYQYNQLILLKPHVLRLRPRCDVGQKLHNFALKIEPKITRKSEITDLDGNSIIKVWFEEATEKLEIKMTAEVETFRSNPFDFLLESWAMKLPIDYPSSWRSQLQPYQQSYGMGGDGAIAELAQDLYQQVEGDTVAFLTTLNHCLNESCEYIIRQTGDAYPAGVTWRKKKGSCRDLAVLFIEVCRAVGLAARFVSGYQEGDPEQNNQDLHAWAEVYLPGGGWRGYDPTLGLAVADTHVALVASAIASYAAPVEGTVTAVNKGKIVESQLRFDLAIERI
ncbi:MAG: transglutaminase family protein [Oscillatoria sp. PMC 1068.18]|nr:transglutaminase family protein [Oscillatoria sp. PMC 1076.18]MEC4987725.1 transglutaminase family protein [Oscillatoria sp. PMC 1068.18]